jgi:hypothetical protein
VAVVGAAIAASRERPVELADAMTTVWRQASPRLFGEGGQVLAELAQPAGEIARAWRLTPPTRKHPGTR